MYICEVSETEYELITHSSLGMQSKGIEMFDTLAQFDVEAFILLTYSHRFGVRQFKRLLSSTIWYSFFVSVAEIVIFF